MFYLVENLIKSSPIGSGNNTKVWSVHRKDDPDKTEFALKTTNKQPLKDVDLKPIKDLRRLNHDNIVKILDCCLSVHDGFQVGKLLGGMS